MGNVDMSLLVSSGVFPLSFNVVDGITFIVILMLSKCAVVCFHICFYFLTALSLIVQQLY